MLKARTWLFSSAICETTRSGYFCSSCTWSGGTSVMMWNSPETRPAIRVAGSGTSRNVTDFAAGLPPQ